MNYILCKRQGLWIPSHIHEEVTVGVATQVLLCDHIAQLELSTLNSESCSERDSTEQLWAVVQLVLQSRWQDSRCDTTLSLPGLLSLQLENCAFEWGCQ